MESEVPSKPARSYRRKATSSRVRLADPTTISGTELKKSTATRKRIMEAAIDCLAETGYVGTTTTTVSDRAGLGRGRRCSITSPHGCR